MNVNNRYILISILVISFVTLSIRIAPFILFSKSKSTPKYIEYLGNYLPPAIISMLIIYCLKNVLLFSFPFGFPEIVGVLIVGLLHVWKRNNLISILGGTITYMILIQSIT